MRGRGSRGGAEDGGALRAHQIRRAIGRAWWQSSSRRGGSTIPNPEGISRGPAARLRRGRRAVRRPRNAGRVGPDDQSAIHRRAHDQLGRPREGWEGRSALEIGTGSGYQAAILAELGADVTSDRAAREPRSEAQPTARGDPATTTVEVVVGDGTEGWPTGGPYRSILVTAGGPSVPQPLSSSSIRTEVGWSCRSAGVSTSSSRSSNAPAKSCRARSWSRSSSCRDRAIRLAGGLSKHRARSVQPASRR